MGVFYYYSADCFNNCQLYVGFISSTNGGSTWSAKRHLAGPMYAAWIASGNNKIGDYIALTFCDGKAFPVFPIGSPQAVAISTNPSTRSPMD